MPEPWYNFTGPAYSAPILAGAWFVSKHSVIGMYFCMKFAVEDANDAVAAGIVFA